jgi:type IV pilus assembly protein PilO
MLKNFNLAAWKGVAIKDPRVGMRAIIGALLAANLVAAVLAFKPFGGSADDLQRQQAALRAQLVQLQARLVRSKALVEKVQYGRKEGDQFLSTYVMASRSQSELMLAELFDMAKAAGVKLGAQSFNPEPVEGSDTLEMLMTTVGCEGTYAQLTKFVNLIDKSPRFLIIDGMTANAPQQQGGNVINVTLRLDAFMKHEPGDPS